MASNGINSATISKIKPALFWGIVVVIIVAAGIFSLVTQNEKSIEQQTRSITSELRCLECEGLSVNDSETATSKTIAKDVAKRLEDGQSRDEIFDYYESVYGEFIRLAPTADGGNWLIYVVPSFFVLVLGFAIYLSIRSSTSKKTQIIFWGLTGVFFVGGVIFFVADSNDSVKSAEQSQQKSSEELLQQSVRESPNNANFRNLAIVQFAKDDFVNALQNFDRAAELDPNDATSKGYASYIVFLSQQYELALERANDAVQTDPENITARFFRGLIYFQSPETDAFKNAENIRRANLDFDEVLRLGPNSDFARQIQEVRQDSQS